MAWRSLFCAVLLCFVVGPLASASPDDKLTFFGECLQASWEGMVALIDGVTALPVDVGTVSTGAVWVRDAKTSPSNIALWITSLVAARDRGFLDAQAAEERLSRVVATLGQMERYEGFFYNWYDLSQASPSGVPLPGAPNVGAGAQRFVSSVDNANLSVALMIASEAFSDRPVAARIRELLDEQDYGFFFRRDGRGWPRVCHGYSVDQGEFSPYDYGTFLTEARLLVLLAMLKGDIPEYPWFSVAGPDGSSREAYMEASPTECCPSSGLPAARIMSSWGGSLFEELFPDLFLDEGSLSPALEANHRLVVQCQISQAEPDTGLWGWSPSESVTGEYGEAGLPCLGSGGRYPKGDVSFYSIALAARYAPDEARTVLERARTLREDAWSPSLGYRDSMSLAGDAICPDILALDKGIEVAAWFNLVQTMEQRPKLSDYLWGYLDQRGAGEKGRAILRAVDFSDSKP